MASAFNAWVSSSPWVTLSPRTGMRECKITQEVLLAGLSGNAQHFPSPVTVQNLVAWLHLTEEAGKCHLVVGPGEKGISVVSTSQLLCHICERHSLIA